MFYFYEIEFRLKYLFFSSSFIVSGFYYNSDLFLFLITHRVAENNPNEAMLFTYSNPAELISLHIMIASFFSSFFILFSSLYHFSSFLKSGITHLEHSFSSILLISSLTLVACFNLYISVFLFPDLWLHSIETSPAFFSLEPTLREYFLTFQSFTLRINFCLIITFFICVFISSFELQVTFYFYRFYVAFNLFIVYFFLSPGYEEIYILIFPVFFLEFILFFSILNHKTRKSLKLSSGHYIK